MAPRLIVIDYAETRLAVVQPLLYKMGIDPHGGGPPVRLLLLARRAGDWWVGLRSGTAGREIEDLLARSQPHPVTPLVPAAENRRQVFAAALAAFAEETGKAVPAAPSVPDLKEKGFERVLYLHMAALAALDGRSIGSAAETLDQTLRHERRFWSQQIEETRLRDAFDRAVAALALVAGAAGGRRRSRPPRRPSESWLPSSCGILLLLIPGRRPWSATIAGVARLSAWSPRKSFFGRLRNCWPLERRLSLGPTPRIEILGWRPLSLRDG